MLALAACIGCSEASDRAAIQPDAAERWDAVTPAPTPPDAEGGTVDAPAPDSGHDGLDSAVADGATADAVPSCHAHDMAGDVLSIARVDTLPNMTGGRIEDGAYDATLIRTLGSATGTYRGTWVFEGPTVHVREQIALSGAPPEAIPRSYGYVTNDTVLSRTPSCGATTAFTNTYSVRQEGDETFLDVRSDIIVVTFRRRR